MVCVTHSHLNYIANLGNTQRVWVVPAISGRVEQLAEMHNTLWQIFEPGDSLVYSGNYLGNPRQNALGADAIQDIRMFTRALVTEGRADRNQIVMLRGINEELIQKALQIQFANKPEDVLIWMGQKGLGPLLEHYGTSLHAGQTVTDSWKGARTWHVPKQLIRIIMQLQ